MDNSPLKKLPAELRLQIYELALYRPGKISIISARRSKKGEKRRIRAIDAEEGPRPDIGQTIVEPAYVYHEKLLALPSTCKQIRNEAMPVFVDINWFEAHPRAIFVADSLIQWATGGAMDLEIAIECRRPSEEGRALLVKRMIGARNLCIKYGLQAPLVLRFTFNFSPPYDAFMSIPWWCTSLAISFNSGDKNAIQKVVNEDLQDMADRLLGLQREVAWMQDSTLRRYTRSIEQENKPLERLLRALDNNSEWSWV